MRFWLNGLLTFLVVCPLSVLAAPVSEDEVLHATFAAFQQPGVLSQQHIEESRDLLAHAAQEGNQLARLVMARQESDGGFPSLSTGGERQLYMVGQREDQN